MKIFVLPLSERFQPNKQPFKYPSHNPDFGVEQDFHSFILSRPEIVATSAKTADWHYLPIYWTRWHLNNNFGQFGLSELQHEVDRVILNSARTFTVCQYDDGPLADLGTSTILLSSRKSKKGIDVPLLCASHRKLFFRAKKKYLASFVGRLSTHPVRQEMYDTLKTREDVYIHDGQRRRSFYVRKILESFVALCPRGYGGSSFRFFEAMQLGVVPCLIGDLDTRPFKQQIDWDEVSLWSSSILDLGDLLDSVNPAKLVAMGARAETIYKDKLRYQKWCSYAIKELELLK